MSSFTRTTKHPENGNFYEAEWLDDYFGNHHYGIKFPDGNVYPEEDYEWITKDPTTPTLREAIKTEILEVLKPSAKSYPGEKIKRVNIATNAIITTVVEYLEGKMPDKHMPTYTNGKIEGDHIETSSQMKDNAKYGSGFNTARLEFQAILNELRSV